MMNYIYVELDMLLKRILKTSILVHEFGPMEPLESEFKSCSSVLRF